MNIKIRELSGTHGCVWQDADEKTHYGFNDAPLDSGTRLWLGLASGNAVRQILGAGMGEIVSVCPGTYGGEARTITVDVAKLDELCAAYWERQNEMERQMQQRSGNCHYCGQVATGVGFFGEPVCSECS